MLNWNIAKNPANWFKVPIMALTAFFALYLIFGFFTKDTDQ